MRERLRALAPLIAALSLAVVLIALAGCAGQTNERPTERDGDQEQQQEQGLKLETVEQWAQSGHARPISFAAQEEGCKNCHDGLTFTETGGGFQPRRAAEGTGTGGAEETTGTAGEESERDWVVATDCRVCHTGVGVEIAAEGSVDGIPNLETAEGGTGALCMACHNGWHPAGAQEGELSAPHYSVQTDIFFGVNYMPVAASGGATQSEEASASPHAKVKNTCVGCHVSGGDNPNHLFAIEDFEGCQGDDCHENDITDGGEAEEDYDGDGNTEAFQAEVEGLLETLSEEINRAAGSTSFKSERGAVVFEGGPRVGENDPVYAAAYNYLYVEKEGSLGIHNPPFTVKLLQDSITAVGGGTGGTGGTGGSGTETTTP